jgi:hypothetical protein
MNIELNNYLIISALNEKTVTAVIKRCSTSVQIPPSFKGINPKSKFDFLSGLTDKPLLECLVQCVINTILDDNNKLRLQP